jgi:hypothetical protein
MVVLYRHPLTHAASLKEKHSDYIKLQSEDSFILEYMNWLGHHEFGMNQKPFLFQGNKPARPQDKNNLDFWLTSWINYYKYALTFTHPNTIFVNYDDYCQHPEKILENITRKMNIAAKLPHRKSFHNPRKVNDIYSADILEEAMVIFSQLKEKQH